MPWNVLAFIVGIVLWFLVGVMWKDKAIMVVHVGGIHRVGCGLFELLGHPLLRIIHLPGIPLQRRISLDLAPVLTDNRFKGEAI